MPKHREFFIVSLPKAIDSDESMTRDFNQRMNRTIPPNTEVHFLGAVEVQGRILTFFREYQAKDRP
jgi:hypothetical protein